MTQRFQIAESNRPLCALCVLCALCGSVLFAQNYQCTWSVVDLGGGTLTSANYKATPSVGQTAIGQIASTSYQAFIGFWQIDTASVGIREEAHWASEEPLTTMLYAPFPNPLTSRCVVRYSLSAEADVTLQLFDLTGRNTCTLVNSTQPAGRYSVPFTPGSSFSTSQMPSGVYFLKLKAGDYQSTRKLVVE